MIIRNDRRSPQKDQTPINEKIRAKEMRVIGPHGEQVGIRSKRDALTLAEAAGFDLVLVAPNATPPVAKIMDYGKYRYEQQRKARDARKNQVQIKIKEVQLRPGIDKHDFETKMRNAHKFLSKGDKVKVRLRFRGREMAHTDLGREVLDRFYKGLEDIADIEKPAKMEGRQMILFLNPKKK